MARFDLESVFGEAAVLERKFDLPRERDAWLQFRRTGIGGSDAAALLGIDTSRGWLTIYNSKVAEPRPEDESSGWNESAYWGNELEDVVAKEFQKRLGFRVYHPAGMLRSIQYPFALATLDRVAVDEDGAIPTRPLEIKTRSAFTKYDWTETCEEKVYAQIQHYMLVTGADATYLAVLIGGQQFRSMVVNRDAPFIANLLDLETRFWEHVRTRTPPAPTRGDSDAVEQAAASEPAVQSVELPDDLADVLEKHRELVALEKSIAISRAELEDKIKLAIGSAHSGFLAGELAATWRPQLSTRLDTKLLKSEMPEVYEQFSRVTQSRVFRVQWKGFPGD